jgi:hypothetical protein
VLAVSSAPFYTDDRVTIYHGDCRDIMEGQLPDNYVDSIVTDPPYELGFMGKGWDGSGIAYNCEVWENAYRILKPGGHLLAFGGTRTWHRLAVAIEDAGFEVRDSIAWMYGSGFPKSHDVSKGIDKQRDDRDDVLRVTGEIARLRDVAGLTNRNLDDAFGFAGMAGHWTSIKSQPTVPTVEQWAVLREMLNPDEWLDAEVWRLNGRKGTPGEAWAEREVVGSMTVNGVEGTAAGYANGIASVRGLNTTQQRQVDITTPATPTAKQWQGWGTALKPAFEPIVVARKPLIGTVAANVLTHGTGALNIDGCRIAGGVPSRAQPVFGVANGVTNFGSGVGRNGEMSQATGRWPANVILDESQAAALDEQSDDTSRFFYCPKAGKSERPVVDGVAHPTVKPLKLMEYLCRLVTPPGGTILEPFSGSGTTIEAALNEGFNVIGIEMTDEYLPLIMARIERHGGKLC